MLKAAIIPVTPFAQNCSLVWCDETMKGAVIDPGGDLDRVLGVAEKQGVTIEKILVTHGHLDHAGAVADLRDRLGLPVEGPQKEDSFWIDRMPENGRQFGFPPLRAFVPTRWLEQGDTVSVGNLVLEVFHCPGHTPGHVVFFHRPSQLAIVGDVLFKGSIGRTDFPRGDHEALIHAIRTRLFPLGDAVRFIPGHGEMSTFGWERKTNPYVSDLAVGA
ncbi:MAG: MBL fold metallo-hydrolase [Rhodospirillaceae bacterium]|nr:MBL fold metallo-hydrolase [Rhodospirillaceae bacterium]